MARHQVHVVEQFFIGDLLASAVVVLGQSLPRPAKFFNV
jgi:hypothetical protein